MRKFCLRLFLFSLSLLISVTLFLVATEEVSATKDVITSIDSGVNAILHDAAWKPDGSYALIVGDGGTVLKYNGTSVVPLSSGSTSDLHGVAWKPDGSCALIVGHDYAILKYDETGFTSINNTIIKHSYGVAWAPNGSFALISGLGSGKVLKYDGTNLTEIYGEFGGLSIAYNQQHSKAIIVGDCRFVVGCDDNTGWIGLLHNATGPLPDITYSQDVAWNSDGDYALIVGLKGFAAAYAYANGEFLEMETNLDMNIDENLYGVAWCPVSNYALICGSDGVLVKYDDKTFGKFFKIWEETDTTLFKVAWKPGSSEAVIVGYYNEQLPNTAPVTKGAIIKFVSNGSMDPNLYLSPISVSPSAIGINETVSSSIDVTNLDIYARTGTLTVMFYTNDTVLDSKQLTLNHRAKENVNFAWYANFTPGDYLVKITVLNGTLPVYNVTKSVEILASLKVVVQNISINPSLPYVNETTNVTIEIKNDNTSLATTLVNVSVYINGTFLTSEEFLGIKSNETIYMKCAWVPTTKGDYNISVKIKTQNIIVDENAKQICVQTKTAEVFNNPPQIAQISDRTITIGTLFTLSVIGTDPDTDNLTYSMDAPTGANLTINSTTGHINGTPTTAGIYSIRVIVSDGGNSTSTVFNLTVNQKEEKNEIPIPKTTGFLPGFESAALLAVVGACVLASISSGRRKVS